MKLYVVYSITDCSEHGVDITIVGVFDSDDKARSAELKYNEQHKQGCYFYTNYTYAPIELNEIKFNNY